jgi:hypothetical protein
MKNLLVITFVAAVVIASAQKIFNRLPGLRIQSTKTFTAIFQNIWADVYMTDFM